LPSDQTLDFQEKTPTSSSQKISQPDPWQSLPGASTGTIDLQDQQSSIGAQHSGKENEDQKEPQNLIYLWVVNYDRVPAFCHHNQAG
jgi:hypothetical protein